MRVKQGVAFPVMFVVCLLLVQVLVTAGVSAVRIVSKGERGKPVTAADARAIGSSLLQSTKATGIQYVREARRLDYPPFSVCHVFRTSFQAAEATHKDETQHDVPREHIGEMWIDVGTGVVLRYEARSYVCNKNRNRGPVRESDLLSVGRLREIGERYIRRAGLSSSGLRLTRSGLSWQRYLNYCCYFCVWYRYVDVPRIGEVRLPEVAMMEIDAETGELDDYFYKSYSTDIKVTPPTVSRVRATKLARKACDQPTGKVIHMELIVFPYRIPTSKERTLAWEVVFEHPNEAGKEGPQAVIDAQDGKTLEAIHYNGSSLPR